MHNKIVAAIIALFFSTAAFAQGRSDYKIERRGGPDLVRESAQLQLIKEPRVQSKEAISNRSYAVGLGQYDSHFVRVDADNNAQTTYDLSEATPMLQLSYAQLPWIFEGRFGWEVDVAYGFQDKKFAGKKTSLHMVPVSVEFIYRAIFKERQLVAPQLGAGGGLMSYYQRGGEGLNTSGSDFFGLISASVWFGLGKWLKPESMAPIDLTLTYNRVLNEPTAGADWAGQSWFLSMGVSL